MLTHSHPYDPAPDDAPVLVPLSAVPDRITYQLRHHDAFESFAAVLEVAQRAGVFLTRADVSPECARYLTGFFRNAGPTRAPLAPHWRP